MISSMDRSPPITALHQLEAFRFGKDEQRSAGDVALENLMHGDEILGLALSQSLDGFFATDQRDLGHRQA